jgi:hypothetical protein
MINLLFFPVNTLLFYFLNSLTSPRWTLRGLLPLAGRFGVSRAFKLAYCALAARSARNIASKLVSNPRMRAGVLQALFATSSLLRFFASACLRLRCGFPSLDASGPECSAAERLAHRRRTLPLASLLRSFAQSLSRPRSLTGLHPSPTPRPHR